MEMNSNSSQVHRTVTRNNGCKPWVCFLNFHIHIHHLLSGPNDFLPKSAILYSMVPCKNLTLASPGLEQRPKSKTWHMSNSKTPHISLTLKLIANDTFRQPPPPHPLGPMLDNRWHDSITLSSPQGTAFKHVTPEQKARRPHQQLLFHTGKELQTRWLIHNVHAPQPRKPRKAKFPVTGAGLGDRS